jgi:diguanylate cyclase (GGDEF)-like protein
VRATKVDDGFVVVTREVTDERKQEQLQRANVTSWSAPTPRSNCSSTLPLSCGVAVFPDHATTAAKLIHEADNALYAAKEAGRNQVVVAPFCLLHEQELGDL